MRVTRCVKVSTTINFTAIDNSLDFSSLGGFLVSFMESARIVVDSNYTHVCDALEQTDGDLVLDNLSRCASASMPRMVGFIDSQTAKLFPAPKYDGMISIRYSQQFLPFTIGTMGIYSTSVAYVPGDVVSSAGNLYQALISNTNVATTTVGTWISLGTGSLVAPGGVVSTIPDSLMVELIGSGGAPMLQAVDPKQLAFAGPEWQKYIDFENSCRGIGSIGGNSITREPVRSRGR